MLKILLIDLINIDIAHFRLVILCKYRVNMSMKNLMSKHVILYEQWMRRSEAFYKRRIISSYLFISLFKYNSLLNKHWEKYNVVLSKYFLSFCIDHIKVYNGSIHWLKTCTRKNKNLSLSQRKSSTYCISDLSLTEINIYK